jgi:hypothetical protein
MSKNTTKFLPSKTRIANVQPCDDIISSRGGLALFARYLQAIALQQPLTTLFEALRKNQKGLPVWETLVQLFCFFVDGTSRHLTHFDRLKQDPSHAALLETTPDKLLSSHMVKRFVRAFNFPKALLFRHLLRQLFLWRLNLAAPRAVVLGLDTMVMDNDEAAKREGVKPTYKKVKGFQPLQLTWGRFIVDALFRSGDKHSNHGDDAVRMLTAAVKVIRAHYRADVPILIRMDAGFFDAKLFGALEALGVGYICGGKLYDDIRAFAESAPATGWRQLRKGKTEWEWLEFGDRRGSWKKFRRAFYCRLSVDGSGQRRFEFARPDSVIYTNLGMGGPVDAAFRAAGEGARIKPEKIVAEYHHRGADELCHRALKDFADEQLPFKNFASNAAWYYTMLTAFFLFEAFAEDVCAEAVPVTAYPTTLRRAVIDVAAKFVRHAGQTILKIARPVWEALDFVRLWELANDPTAVVWV